MNNIPEVIEQLYYNWVMFPDSENWPQSLQNSNPEVVRRIYAFYAGLRLGLHISNACADL